MISRGFGDSEIGARRRGCLLGRYLLSFFDPTPVPFGLQDRSLYPSVSLIIDFENRGLQKVLSLKKSKIVPLYHVDDIRYILGTTPDTVVVYWFV